MSGTSRLDMPGINPAMKYPQSVKNLLGILEEMNRVTASSNHVATMFDENKSIST